MPKSRTRISATTSGAWRSAFCPRCLHRTPDLRRLPRPRPPPPRQRRHPHRLLRLLRRLQAVPAVLRFRATSTSWHRSPNFRLRIASLRWRRLSWRLISPGHRLPSRLGRRMKGRRCVRASRAIHILPLPTVVGRTFEASTGRSIASSRPPASRSMSRRRSPPSSSTTAHSPFTAPSSPRHVSCFEPPCLLPLSLPSFLTPALAPPLFSGAPCGDRWRRKAQDLPSLVLGKCASSPRAARPRRGCGRRRRIRS